MSIGLGFFILNHFIITVHNNTLTCIKLIIQMRNVTAGQPQDLDLAELPVGRFRWNEQTQRVERRVHAAWDHSIF